MTPKKEKDKSMFKELFEQTRNKNKESEEVEEPALSEPEPEVIEARKPGRPRGRRSDPDYTKLCALIPMDLLLDVQSILIQKRRKKINPRPKDMSALVESLLTEWAEKNRED